MAVTISRNLLFSQLIWQMAVRELRGRFAGSVMGLFWSVIHPLITLALWTFVFSYILRIRFGDGGITEFALYLFCGMAPYLSFQEIVQNCTVSVTNRSQMVKTLVFPIYAVPFSIALASLITQMIALGILSIAIAIMHPPFPVYLPLVVPLALVLTFFALGLGLITCTLHVFFRDTAQLVGVLLMMWLYATPIFYSSEHIPQSFRFLLYVNPLAYLVNIYRSLLLVHKLPSFEGLLIFVSVSVLTFLVGSAIYRHNYPKFIDEL